MAREGLLQNLTSCSGLVCGKILQLPCREGSAELQGWRQGATACEEKREVQAQGEEALLIGDARPEFEDSVLHLTCF